jgi:hypothetical protein
VYVWHNGEVHLISEGTNPQGVENKEEGKVTNSFSSSSAPAAMSASGSDIFFSTGSPLVGQDTDVLRDIYDARVGGGFPAPAAEPSCSRGACQKESSLPSFGSATSSSFAAEGNLTAPAISVAPSMESKHAPLTEAQQLAKALKACKGKPKNKRAACESQARRKYKAQQLANALKACKGKPKNKRAACESQARRKYGR